MSPTKWRRTAEVVALSFGVVFFVALAMVQATAAYAALAGTGWWGTPDEPDNFLWSSVGSVTALATAALHLLILHATVNRSGGDR